MKLMVKRNEEEKKMTSSERKKTSSTTLCTVKARDRNTVQTYCECSFSTLKTNTTKWPSHSQAVACPTGVGLNHDRSLAVVVSLTCKMLCLFFLCLSCILCSVTDLPQSVFPSEVGQIIKVDHILITLINFFLYIVLFEF